ncbi:hypothetical protein IHQ56_09730 [Methylobacillus flagellatus]|nr:hypothetical protein [Methylobacillus flagellatus]
MLRAFLPAGFAYFCAIFQNQIAEFALPLQEIDSELAKLGTVQVKLDASLQMMGRTFGLACLGTMLACRNALLE